MAIKQKHEKKKKNIKLVDAIKIKKKTRKLDIGYLQKSRRIKESNIRNICRNFLAIPQFKGLKKLTLDHCVYITYYLVTNRLKLKKSNKKYLFRTPAVSNSSFLDKIRSRFL